MSVTNPGVWYLGVAVAVSLVALVLYWLAFESTTAEERHRVPESPRCGHGASAPAACMTCHVERAVGR